MSKTINAGRVTFVPKDNFSNNISYKKFDIVTYNGSSYFAKKDTIGHTPTEEEFWQLVAEKGQNGAPGAVKMQVVDTLPETGETDTIYLVKKNNPGEQNLYDEYVYTNTGWEHIGDTSVDLTDYYTKNETDNKIFESIPILYNSTSPNNSSHSEFDLNEASRVITTLYKTGGRFFIYHNTTFDVPDVLIAIPSKITQITRQFGYGCYNSTGNSFGISVKGLNCIIEGTWNNDTFACRYVQFNFSKQSLEPATNTITSTSTAPVQGNVIKKYVDDNVKTYTAGENITISEDNVISASGGDINDVGIYTWVYSDFPNTDNYNLKTKYNDFFKNMVNDAYSKGKKGIILMKTGTNTSGLNNMFQYTFTASNCDLQLKPTKIALYGNPLVTSMNFYQRVNFEYAQIRISGTWTDNTFEPESIYWDGITNVSFLSVDNMWNYTPKNNYNPATKKYVDDQVGNINTVLATLTTVSEVSK